MAKKRNVPRQGFGIIKRTISREGFARAGFGIARPVKVGRGMIGMLVVLAIVGIIIYLANYGTKAPIKGLATAPEELSGIGTIGIGGDPLLNQQKNRFTIPTAVSDMTVQQVIGIPSQLLDASGRRKRASWPSSAKSYLEQEEQRGVRVTGYLTAAKESGPESCNGYMDSLRDYHIWVSDDPVSPKAGAMIVEITPRWKVVHPEWRLRYLQSLAQQHAKVRVTGWLMWDEEHASEVEKSRATQWEVHPVTNFEVFSGGEWRPLAVQ